MFIYAVRPGASVRITGRKEWKHARINKNDTRSYFKWKDSFDSLPSEQLTLRLNSELFINNLWSGGNLSLQLYMLLKYRFGHAIWKWLTPTDEFGPCCAEKLEGWKRNIFLDSGHKRNPFITSYIDTHNYLRTLYPFL